jgi:hypothetical protein
LLHEVAESRAARSRGEPGAATTPSYLLLWESDADALQSGIDVLLRSEGGGPRTRDNLVLAVPREGESPHLSGTATERNPS